LLHYFPPMKSRQTVFKTLNAFALSLTLAVLSCAPSAVADVATRQVLIDTKLVEVSKTVSEQVIYEIGTGRDVKAEIAVLVKIAPDQSAAVEASIVSYGQGADFRRIQTQRPFIVAPTISDNGTVNMRIEPADIEKIYINKASIASKAAPLLFAAIGSQYEGAGAKAADNPGQTCPVTGQSTGGDGGSKGGFSQAIDKAGMAAGLGLLSSQAKGQLEGVKARWTLSAPIGYKFDLKFDTFNVNNKKTETLTVPITLNPSVVSEAQPPANKNVGPIPAIRVSQSVESGQVKTELNIAITPYSGRKMRLIVSNTIRGIGADSDKWVPQNSQLEYAGADWWGDFYDHKWDDFDEEGYCYECDHYEPEADIRNYDDDGYYHDPDEERPLRAIIEQVRYVAPDPLIRITVDPSQSAPALNGSVQGEKLTFITDYPVTRALFKTQALNKETRQLLTIVTPVLIQPADPD